MFTNFPGAGSIAVLLLLLLFLLFLIYFSFIGFSKYNIKPLKSHVRTLILLLLSEPSLWIF